MLDSETVQVGLLTFRAMIHELTPQGEPARHWWSSGAAVYINGGLESAHIRIADDDDGLGAIRGLVWAAVFQVGLAIAVFLCWQLWLFA
jgi:hypothetical protein